MNGCSNDRCDTRQLVLTQSRSAGVPDRGLTLVEVLVAMVLLALVVVASLAGLRTTIASSAIDRNHANAFAWLQAASDSVYATPRVSCTAGRPAVISAYDDAAKRADRPVMWDDVPGATIEVYNVEFLGRTNPDAIFEWDAGFCFEGTGFETSPLYTQRVSIRVTLPDGLQKTLQMVKSA